MDVSVRVQPHIRGQIDSQESLLNWYNDEHSSYQCIPGTQTLIPSQPEYSFDYIFLKESNIAQVYKKVVAPIFEKSLKATGLHQNSPVLWTKIFGIGLVGVPHQKFTNLLNNGRNEIKEINSVMFPKYLKMINMIQAVRRVRIEREISKIRMKQESPYRKILRILIDLHKSTYHFRNKILELENLLRRKTSEVEMLKEQLSTVQKLNAQPDRLTTDATNMQLDRYESELSKELEKMSHEMELKENENNELRSIVETNRVEIERVQKQNSNLQEQVKKDKEIRERLELDLQTLQNQSPLKSNDKDPVGNKDKLLFDKSALRKRFNFDSSFSNNEIAINAAMDTIQVLQKRNEQIKNQVETALLKDKAKGQLNDMKQNFMLFAKGQS